MKKAILALPFALLLLPLQGHAQAQLTGDTVEALSACDARFFRHLTKSAGRGDIPSFNRGKPYSWFAVQDRSKEGLNSVKFNPPLAMLGLPVDSYFDEKVDLDSLGTFYSWGFRVRGTPAEIVARIRPHVVGADRLRQQGPHFARTDVKLGQFDWMPMDIKGGRAPARNVVERVFLVEGDRDGYTRVGCSIQGTVTFDVLKALRPDIPADQLPGKIEPPEYTGQIPAEVYATVKSAASANPAWTPKFKSVEFRESSDAIPGFETRTIITPAPDGLVSVDTYNRVLEWGKGKLSFANLFQLNNGPPTRPLKYQWNTDKLELTLPKTLTVGEKMRFRNSTRTPDTDLTGSLRSYFVDCKLISSSPAERILAGTAGLAHYFDCDYDGRARQQYAFVEDLGLFLINGYFKSDTGAFVQYRYSNVKIQK